MIDIEFAEQCHQSAARREALEEVRREVQARLNTCAHSHGFEQIQGQLVCRDCGGVR